MFFKLLTSRLTFKKIDGFFYFIFFIIRDVFFFLSGRLNVYFYQISHRFIKESNQVNN